MIPLHPPLASLLDSSTGLAAAVRIDTSVGRVLQQAQQAVVARRLPDDSLTVASIAHCRHVDVLLTQPEVKAPHATQFRELAECQVNGAAHALIGVLLNALVAASHIADGHAH